MNWQQQIVNPENVPSGLNYVYIQEGKAVHFRDKCAFGSTSKVLGFITKEQANYFVEHWDNQKMFDYKQACLVDDYIFYVFLVCPNGYYADDITMSK